MLIDREEAFQIVEGALTIDGFDDCIIGVASRCGQPDLIVYDFDKIIATLTEQGMDYDDALDYYEFNIAGAWVGEGTPLIMERMMT